MRTTLNLDDDLMKRAMQSVGVTEKTKVLHMGLQALIRDAAYRELAGMFGVLKGVKIKAPRRRRYTW